MNTKGIGGAEVFTPLPKPVTNTPLPQPVCKSPVAARLHRLINVARSDVGVKPLRGSAVLYTSAHLWGQRMADTALFAHAINGIRAVEEMVRLGYPPHTLRGQNIAWGYPTPDSVFDDWMESPPHKENILSVNYKELGVAVVVAQNGRLYWVLDFGGGTTTRPDLCLPPSGPIRDIDAPSPDTEGTTVRVTGYEISPPARPWTYRLTNTTNTEPVDWPVPGSLWGREGETPLRGASRPEDRDTDDPL